MKAPLECPCGRGRYATCCGRWHAGVAAPSAELLMRSRYTAYALGLRDYLIETWAPETCPDALVLDESPQPKWIGLDVRNANETGDTATVEFVARYRLGGRAYRMHETSHFVKRDDRWLYVDGIQHDD